METALAALLWILAGFLGLALLACAIVVLGLLAVVGYLIYDAFKTA